MANAPAFDELFASRPLRSNEPVREPRWWASREAWITLTLVIIAQLPVISSLQQAEWVAEMPSMWLAAGAGLAAGWVLAQSRVAGALAILAALVVCTVVSVALVVQRMVVTEPGLGAGLQGRATEFWLRMQAWGTAMVNNNPSTDQLPFVVLLIAVVCGIAYLAAWAVVRWHNAWMALVPGGIVLLTNISYLPGQPSIALIMYLFIAVLLVTRLEFLRAASRWRSERVREPELMSIVVLLVGAAVATILVSAAWIVPTANHWGPVASAWERVLAPVTSRVDAFGELFVGINSKKVVPAHSFGSTLPLQGKMVLSSTPLYEVTATEAGNMRGAVYDAYSGGGWKVSASSAAPLAGTTVQAAGLGTPLTRAQVRRPVTTQITVLAEGAPPRRLLTVGDPVTTDVPAQHLLGPNGQPLALVPHDPADPGDKYGSVGAVSAASVPTLQGAGTNYPAGLLATYTQLSSDFPPEVRALARDIAGNARNPYEAARRIESYLRSTYTYTLAPPPAPPRKDAVAAFLFDQRAGYFDQFASAMAVMLRAQGVPARIATGFVLDPADLDSETKTYRVSELRAWTWPEVYFPGLGWVEFNPTPSRPLVQRPGDDSEARAAAGAEEALALPDDFTGQPFDDDPFAGVDVGFAEPEGSALGAVGRAIVQIISVLLVLSVVGLVGAVIARIVWERYFAGLRPPSARWGKVQRLASWAGVGPPEYLTPVEAAEALGVVIGQRDSLRNIARAYTRSRYSRLHDAEESEAEARAADMDYRRVRQRLSGMIIYRLTHFGRPEGTMSAGRHAAALVARR